jgi:hypothetical protein
MGHDITGYNQVAYLRRGAFESEKEKIELYKLLESEMYYHSSSGSGDYVVFEMSQIVDAYNKAKERKSSKDIINFLANLIRVKDCFVVIHFG